MLALLLQIDASGMLRKEVYLNPDNLDKKTQKLLDGFEGKPRLNKLSRVMDAVALPAVGNEDTILAVDVYRVKIDDKYAAEPVNAHVYRVCDWFDCGLPRSI